VPVEERPLAERLYVDPWGINILLLHGSREGIGASGRKITCPFSDAELMAQPFDYTALGHYHAHAEIRDAEGTVRAAYAGCPQGRGLDETGEKGALLVTVTKDEGGRSTSVEFRPLARHRIHLLEIDVTGLESTPALAAALEARLAAQGARWDDDVIVVRLEGRWPRGTAPSLAEGFADRLFHLALDRSRVVPDYDLAALELQEHTVAGAFVRSLLPRLRAEESDARRRIVKNALYYGLDALNDESVRPRYEE
jgi:DNA repair exonuclease SbcCD nuclease subunit